MSTDIERQQEALGLRAQEAGEAALEALLFASDDTCACTTCLVREVLEAAWPHLQEAAILGEAS